MPAACDGVHAVVVPAQILDLREYVVQIFLPAAACCHQNFASGGQAQAGGQAFEQRQAQTGLGIEDLAIDRKGRDIEFLCGAADQTEPTDHDKIAQETRKGRHWEVARIFGTGFPKSLH